MRVKRRVTPYPTSVLNIVRVLRLDFGAIKGRHRAKTRTTFNCVLSSAATKQL